MRSRSRAEGRGRARTRPSCSRASRRVPWRPGTVDRRTRAGRIDRSRVHGALLDVEAAVEQLDEAVVVLEETSDAYGVVRAELTYASCSATWDTEPTVPFHTSSVRNALPSRRRRRDHRCPGGRVGAGTARRPSKMRSDCAKTAWLGVRIGADACISRLSPRGPPSVAGRRRWRSGGCRSRSLRTGGPRRGRRSEDVRGRLSRVGRSAGGDWQRAEEIFRPAYEYACREPYDGCGARTFSHDLPRLPWDGGIQRTPLRSPRRRASCVSPVISDRVAAGRGSRPGSDRPPS